VAVTSTAVYRPALPARLMGLGSIFGKSFRDSRRAALIAGGLYALIVVVTGAELAQQFDTVAKRLAVAAELGGLPPAFQGILGTPIHIEQLGGFVSWRVLNFLPVLLGIWAIVALSGTLAGELARGSLDPLASTPLARRRLAVEKAGGYLAALVLAVVITGLGIVAAVAAFGTLPGDAVGLDAVAAHLVWIFLASLIPGALAFAAAPLLGRGGAIAIGAIALFGSFVVNGYADTIPAFDAVRGLSYLSFSGGHRPLAGAWDWPAMAVLAVVTVGLLATGVAAFERRDILVPGSGRIPLPQIGLWLRGPLSRSFGERLPAALAWGFGLGLYGFVIAASANEFVRSLGSIPQLTQMVQQFFPDADILSTGGFLQLAFFIDALLAIGIAAGTFAAGWASDENDRRLEVVLAAPLSRAGWTVRAGIAVMAGIAVVGLLMMGGVALGAATQGDDVARPVIGASVLALYAMALAGIGLAVGGWWRPSLAAPVTIGLGLAFFLLDLIGGILRLPDWILGLALQRHLGRPMIGDYDAVGLVACTLLAVGGIAICAVGMRRRDIGR
jgi:ABC-2 type transport system permease protein